MYEAIGVEPTKPTALMRGSCSIASTASLSPFTTFSTPGGSPASMNSSARRSGTEGSRSDGLRMKALPQAIAGAAFHSGIMAGKLNGVMPATTPERLAQREHVDAGAGGFAEFALQQMRDADGELDHLEPALDVAARVRHGLAMLGRQQPGEGVHVAVDEVDEAHHHAGAALRVLLRPCDLGGGGVVDGGGDLGGAGKRERGPGPRRYWG